jgi:hypothetical protein
VSGNLQSAGGPVNVTDRPDHPATPARFADLAELDISIRVRHAERALAKFREAFSPGELRVVESD